MATSTSFRFAIADDSVRSECWSLFTNADDVYLSASAYKQALKISLHGSGVCQVALLQGFYEEHIEWRENAPNYRSILRWKRLPIQEGKGAVVASILFASYEFWPEREAIPASKVYTAIAPPPDGFGRMVNVVYSRDDPKLVAALGDWIDDLLFSMQLPNGEYVGLISQLEKLPEGFFDYAPLESPYALTLGIPEEEMGDLRGISCFDCAQLFEGHGCIRSLHNMRLITLTKTDE